VSAEAAPNASTGFGFIDSIHVPQKTPSPDR
jgi:hypothetical protein